MLTIVLTEIGDFGGHFLEPKHAEVSLPVMVGLLQTSARARQMSCAYYVTFPDANLLTLETNTALPRESFCFPIR